VTQGLEYQMIRDDDPNVHFTICEDRVTFEPRRQAGASSAGSVTAMLRVMSADAAAEEILIRSGNAW
jgi:hypothetical protein